MSSSLPFDLRLAATDEVFIHNIQGQYMDWQEPLVAIRLILIVSGAKNMVYHSLVAADGPQ